MKKIIEQDICAKCVHLEATKPFPLFGPFEIVCECAQDWPYNRVSETANAISGCPAFLSVERTT